MWSLQVSEKGSFRQEACSQFTSCIIIFGTCLGLFKPLSVESKYPVLAARSVEKWLNHRLILMQNCECSRFAMGHSILYPQG